MKFKGDILIIFVTIILVAVEGLPLEHYLPFFRHIRNDRNSVITDYFNIGLSYIEIVAFLASLHGMTLSLRQLKRILRHLRLGRRLNRSNVGDVLDAVMQELNGSGSIIGYRAMHQRLRNNYGLVVTRETVRQVSRCC